MAVAAIYAAHAAAGMTITLYCMLLLASTGDAASSGKCCLTVVTSFLSVNLTRVQVLWFDIVDVPVSWAISHKLAATTLFVGVPGPLHFLDHRRRLILVL